MQKNSDIGKNNSIKKIFCLIPARSGSKSIKNKNSSHTLRFKWIVKLLRSYVRPALYRIGLGMLWSSGKQSFFVRFFKTKSDENENVKAIILENEDFSNLLHRHNKFLERITLK